MALRGLAAAALLSAAAAARVQPLNATPTGTKPFVGGYVLLNGPDGLAKLSLLASQAATLPINRLWLSFVSPTMVYVPGSKTLALTGLNLTTTGDAGFGAVAASVKTLAAAGVDVLLSIGGWDMNCFPYAYTYYSVGGYGTNTPNYWKITDYCSGSLSNANAANEYCYTCEPRYSNETLADFDMFPEPSWSPTWKQAVAYVTATAGAPEAPVWDAALVPGASWTDPKTGVTTTVPGSPLPQQMGRDPYADVVHLASELGCAGVDLDYEEMWHADMNKYGSGPYTLPQTVYKYAAIMKDIKINIDAIAPGMMLSTAASAVGGWAGNWWGGNLKGVLLQASAWYPDLIGYVASSGGINVMSYDLSDNEEYYECPAPGVCTLSQQVAYYMGQYALAGIPANVGYETGTPAYPDPTEDPSHQLPLTLAELATITSATQPSSAGGFFWEIFKQPQAPGEATPTQVAQAICRVVLPGSPRCAGQLPVWNATTTSSAAARPRRR